MPGILPEVKRWFASVHHWIFPKTCCFCDEVSDHGKEICSTCYSVLPWAYEICYRCGSRLKTENEHHLCEICQEKPPPFDRLCTLFYYQPPITKLITRLKFSGQLVYGRILGELFAAQIPLWYKNDSLPEAILPVPLSLQRLRKRGYNQSLEIIRPILKTQPMLPLLSTCKKVRHTIAQSELNREQRNRNLKGAFKIIDANSLKNIEHIAIFDDVVTTGSTVKALSEILKEQGVARVDVFCCCRA